MHVGGRWRGVFKRHGCRRNGYRGGRLGCFGSLDRLGRVPYCIQILDLGLAGQWRADNSWPVIFTLTGFEFLFLLVWQLLVRSPGLLALLSGDRFRQLEIFARGTPLIGAHTDPLGHALM